MTKNNATIITFNSQKGGVGKSVLSYNYGVYEANRGLKVLYIDTDYQENSTSNFNQINKQSKKNSSIYRAFIHDSKNPQEPFPKNFHPIHVSKNIDLMASSPDINNAIKLMENNGKKAFEAYVMLHVFTALNFIDKYDLILIDTHNSMNLATINSLVVSDYVISPIIPNRYGITAIKGMVKSIDKEKQSLLNPVNQKSLVNCKLLFVGNMIKNTTNIGKAFSNYVKNHHLFIAAFPEREIFNKATTAYESVFDLAAQSSSDNKLINNKVVPEFKKLENATINN